ncbi:NAD(P)-dependent oxidoreductase [Tritonibacter scottomollicae]|uniref:NAD(P)-dependent oxidoreductase n=1 Tax=Tritonibacter scottomollicae TaxID=483013 RepID=UPI003BAC53A6
MASSHQASGIHAARLSAAEIADNFGDLHAPFDAHEATVAADRCYFCFDAPCMTACPTSIDIPQFIREIQGGHAESAAKTILNQNILGGMCARVCPTETLCEEVCVREVAEGKPVEIGRLQRYATDLLMEQDVHPFTRAASTGKKIAVVGAGPAGLAAAHRLAMKGHDVVVYEAKSKAGGLNEFGIAAYKSTNDFAAREVDWLLQIGGISIEYDKGFGKGLTLEGLKADHDAVFLSIGLAGVNALRTEGEDKEGVRDAVSFIEDLRQADDLTELSVGRNVVVIGGGMTAVDAAVQSKLLGAENVTIAYRRDRGAMGASRFEQDLAASKGVKLMFNVMPKAIHGNGASAEIELEYTEVVDGRVKGIGQTTRLAADQVFKAIGQTLEGAPQSIDVTGGKIAVSETGRTSVAGVWAGGDCASGGEDLTVTAVAEGRDAAEDIHTSLMG